MPIQVGKALANVDLGMQGDNTGDNISVLNPNFCELTAHYWYWKNCEHSEYVGLNHYRRYFDFGGKAGSKHVAYANVSVSEAENFIKNIPDFDLLFGKYDIVLAKPNVYSFNLMSDYCRCHIREDYDILRDVISELYPAYAMTFEQVMKHYNKLSHYNMFVTKRVLFEEYSEWLFNILFEVQKRVKISPYPSQARVFGYMSERLLNVWVKHQNLKVKYEPVIKVCDDGNRPVLRQRLSDLKNDLIFKISDLSID